MTWIRCQGSVCFGMYLTCGTVICCLSFLPVQIKQPSWTRGITLQNKLGKKGVPCQKGGDLSHLGCTGRPFPAVFPPGGRTGKPWCPWRVCSVTCSEVFLFHNNHCTCCLENGAFWLCLNGSVFLPEDRAWWMRGVGICAGGQSNSE